MNAIVCNKYGTPDVLELKEVDIPVLKDNEILVRVFAASLNYGNLVLLRGEPILSRLAFGLFKPKYAIPGGDVAGCVEAIGKDVTEFKVGDEVFGDLSGSGWGGFAEYVAVPEGVLVYKPMNVSFEEAAAVPMAAVTALQGLRDKGKIEAGQKVLIYGASGGVGTFAVQIAKAFEVEVTAVCSTRNVDLVKSIGADYVIDYKCEDFTKQRKKYDLILAVNGYQPISFYKHALNTNGRYVMIGGSGNQMFQAMVYGPLLSIVGDKKMGNILHRPRQQDLVFIKELLESGNIKPVIDKCYTLREVQDAFRYFEEGRAKGKVVITI